MKKIIPAILMMAIAIASVGAVSNLSVPLSSDAYRVIRNAEIRGIIPAQPEARPFSASHVVSLLTSIKDSGRVEVSEMETIDALLSSFDQTYGVEECTRFSDALAKHGYLTLYSDGESNISAGARFSTDESLLLTGEGFDTRNKVTAYIRGDLLSSVSFFMDFSLLLDRIDHRAFLYTDFTQECEGWYQDLMNGGEKVTLSPFSGIGDGLGMSPEVAASFADDKVLLRFGAVKRDWGPGRNNLALSASARSFDGIEFTFSPSSAFSFSWLMGSLGKSYLALEGEAKPIGDEDLHSNIYDNNFTSQRVEVSPFKGLRAAIYETVVWRKRSELAYMNPLGIYMFSQNYIGDFDNMLAGFDVSYTLPGIGRVYGSLSIDEMNSANPKKMLTFARNIIALQGGVNLVLPVFSFSTLTLQATYLPPFYGTHYLFGADANPWGDTAYGIAYVNKGQSLSYPLLPDSLELLASFGTTLPGEVSLDVTVKDQMRSAQYSINEEYGTGLDVIMGYHDSDNYSDKHFFSYLWRNTLDVSLEAEKAFSSLPLTVRGGVECIVDSKRPYSVATAPGTVGGNVDYPFNNGYGTTMGDGWTTSVGLIGKLGFSLYY